ncbi:MAG: 5-methylcytosine-specific restriction enzyme subunit McrC [Verrucomicrobiales bacterium]|jgi:5-methylcytosine-specific restriction enzyme subunit McrC
MTLEIELREYQTLVVDGITPTDADMALAAKLDTDFERKLRLRWLREDRLEITSTSWVGVVHLEAARIVVRPKFAGTELRVVRMLEYAGGLDRARAFNARRSIELSGVDLLELVASLFAAETERIMLEGLLQDYRTEEADLPMLRGTLRHREQATRRFGQLDRLECRYDEFDTNILDNQLLAVGAAVGARLLRAGPTRLRLRRLSATLETNVGRGPTTADEYRRRLVYGRRNERYRRAHDLALLLLDQIGIDDPWSGSPSTSHVFLLNMNTVFEVFVIRLVGEAFAGTSWSVDGQRRTKSVVVDRDSRKTYASVIPDIVLRSGAAIVPLDCKYKLYGEGKKISSGDIYQSFLYAFSLGVRPGSLPAAGIIYPARPPLGGRMLSIGRDGGDDAAVIAGLELDLVSAVDALDDGDAKAELLKTVRSLIGGLLPSVEAADPVEVQASVSVSSDSSVTSAT